MLLPRRNLMLARFSWFCCLIVLIAPPLRASELNSHKSDKARIPSRQAPPAAATRYTVKNRLHDYLKRTYGAQAFAGVVLGAAWGQVWDDPSEWRQGFAGYGRRLGSGYARSVISNNIQLGVGALDHDDPRYIPSSAKGVWPRVMYAVAHTFAYRTQSGGKIAAISALAGSYAAAFASNAWYPASQANVHDALFRGSTAMLSSIGANLLKEFSPRFRKIFP